MGVKFTADTSGFVSGIRFYKSAANTGTHIGNLWTSNGQLLATATFTGETTSGWQTVNFSSPILLTANTIYVASYHTNTGHTSDDPNYFTNIGVDNSPLHAPASGASGGNGVRTLSAGSVFPTTTNLDSNYWVDVVFLASSSPPPLQSLTLNPTNVRGGVDLDRYGDVEHTGAEWRCVGGPVDWQSCRCDSAAQRDGCARVDERKLFCEYQPRRGLNARIDLGFPRGNAIGDIDREPTCNHIDHIEPDKRHGWAHQFDWQSDTGWGGASRGSNGESIEQ